MPEKLFGTDGIRGKANEYPITPEIALRTGQAISRVLKSNGANHNRVIIGKDTRISGYMLETALTSGLVSSGMDVFLVGPMPTPGVAHLTKSMGCGAGIMLTASHNPYEDNGVKIFGPDGYKLNDELEAQVERDILSGAQTGGVTGDRIGKAYRIDDARGRYIEYAKQSLGSHQSGRTQDRRRLRAWRRLPARPADLQGARRQGRQVRRRSGRREHQRRLRRHAS